MGVDFAGEGLLDGLDGDARTARLELLERLEAEGETRRAAGRRARTSEAEFAPRFAERSATLVPMLSGPPVL